MIIRSIMFCEGCGKYSGLRVGNFKHHFCDEDCQKKYKNKIITMIKIIYKLIIRQTDIIRRKIKRYFYAYR